MDDLTLNVGGGGAKLRTEELAVTAQHVQHVKLVDVTAGIEGPHGLATQITLAAILTELLLHAKLEDTQPISAASLPLPTGAATQTTLASLLTELSLKAKLTDTQPVSASSLPLPAGAATAALQTQPGTDIGDVTVNNGSGGAAVNVQDGGNSITVDGTVTANPATAAGKTLTFVPVAQGAAGTTQLAGASPGNRHKIVGCILTMSLAGTLKFLDGSGDLTGAMDIALTGGFVLPTSAYPYQQSAVNSALSITTTLGAAKGVVAILTEA